MGLINKDIKNSFTTALQVFQNIEYEYVKNIVDIKKMPNVILELVLCLR